MTTVIRGAEESSREEFKSSLFVHVLFSSELQWRERDLSVKSVYVFCFFRQKKVKMGVTVLCSHI